jgi:hypothetical protein
MDRHLPASLGGPVPRRSAPRVRLHDMVGTPLFWLTIAITICAVVPVVFFRAARPWIGSAILLMWTGFFTTNAIRSRRTHSVISAPVYFLAAILLAATASGFVEVQIWMVWLIGAGIIAANLSERFIGKYL